MTFWGVLRDGSEFLLGEPLEAVLSYDRDAPADLLKAVFPAQRMWEELVRVTVYDGGCAVFCGLVDEQNTRISASGLSVELVCRSLEAVLLDNEAPPMPMKNPSLELLEWRLLAPLEFPRALGDRAKKQGELAVEKGDSCWTVLERFCREFLGTVPYVDEEGAVHCEGLPERKLELRDIRQAELSYLPCRRLSAVWQQSYRGSYDTPYGDPGAAQLRRRYLSMQSGRNPKELLLEGERESFQITVECAGAWWPVRGAEASLELERAGRFENCPVRSAVYLRDGGGERTRLVLEKGGGAVCG